MRTVQAAFALTLLAGCASAQATPEPTCMPREVVVQVLEGRHGETLRATLVSKDGLSVIEVYAASGSGTWTVLRSTPNGISCLLEVGEGYFPGPSEPVPAAPTRRAVPAEWEV